MRVLPRRLKDRAAVAWGYSGDGGAATNAELMYPTGVAVDAYGDLFIADPGTNTIREVGAKGIITTVAGDGISGYSGDGGMATNAELHSPEDVSVDAFGNLFIADLFNNRIRKVGTHGMITTFAGNGTGGYAGDGGPPANAELYYPSGVALDAAENLLIADEENQLQFVRIFWFDSRHQTCIIQLAVLICIKANERIAQL